MFIHKLFMHCPVWQMNPRHKTQKSSLVQLQPYSSIMKGVTQDLIMCRWAGVFSQCLLKTLPLLQAMRSYTSLLKWKRGLPTVFPAKPGKAGRFLARVRHATVIQIGLNYSGVGPHLLCGHICCCAGTFKLGHFLLKFMLLITLCLSGKHIQTVQSSENLQSRW